MPTTTMPIRDWFRPPRQMLLVFFVVALVSTATLGWLAWELLASDRAAAAGRHREDLERAADALTAALDRHLSALDRRLDPNVPLGDDQGLPAGVTRVTLRGTTPIVEPAGSLPYLPSAVPSEMPETRELRTATRLEQVERDLGGALLTYLALTDDVAAPVRAVALTRVARVQRKQRNWSGALATYDRLVDLGNIGIEGLPARLVARVGRISVFESQGDDGQIREEATRLKDDLEQGRLHVTRAQFASYATEVERLLGAAPVVDDDALARAAAARWVSEDLTSEGEGRGRRLVEIDGRTAFVSWRPGGLPGEFTAIVMGRDALEHLVAAIVPPGMAWSISDPGGRITIGDRPSSGDAASRAAGVTGLPLTLRVSAANPSAATESPRLTLLVAVLFGVAVVAGVGWYFLWRGISREVRVSRLQSDFVAAVSHEFRSPLTSLRHIADLLASGRVETEARRERSYALLVNETERLGQLVEGLLDFRRLQEGQVTFQFEDRVPSDLVREVVAAFERRLDSGENEIEVQADDGLPAVRVDREAFGRALWNLLDNAVKYSPRPGRVEVRVAADPATAHVAVTVRDNGPGIPADEQTLIFDRFVRGADAKARHIRGTGIGLAMAREIVRAHGGDLTVTSRPGAGSAFTIALPPAGT